MRHTIKMDPVNKKVSLAGQKVLITGARGFLGSHLRVRLIQLGAEVYGVSRSPSIDAADNIRWFQADFADIDSVRGLVGSIKPDIVFHLGGFVTAMPDMEVVLPTMTSLLVSTVNTLIAARETGCRRVLLAGSLHEPQWNLHDPIPSSPYAAAKWASSIYARMFYKLYQVPAVILRTFMTYGPQQHIQKLVPHVARSLLKGEAPKLSSGDWQADWIYVDDVIDGFIAAAETSEIEGCTIDLGSGTLVSIRKLVNHIVKLTHARVEPVFGAMPDRPFEEARSANCSEAYAKLAWKPGIDLEEGLKRTVEWYKKRLNKCEADSRQT